MGKGTNRLRLPLDKIKEAFESIVDRADKITSIATNAGVAYIGYRALKHPVGALVGLLGLRLAQSPNLASGAAGIAALTGLGALNLIPPAEPVPGAAIPIEELLAKLRLTGWTPTEVPIADRPEDMINIETEGGFYIER